MKRKRIPFTKQYPWVVKLPKGAKSPTNSVYKQFDIVKQTKVLNTIAPSTLTIRSAGPFTLSTMVGAKIKIMEAHNATRP